MVPKPLKSEKSLKNEPKNKIWRMKTNMIMSKILKTNPPKNYTETSEGAQDKIKNLKKISKQVLIETKINSKNESFAT
jgi:hypothetical protein